MLINYNLLLIFFLFLLWLVKIFVECIPCLCPVADCSAPRTQDPGRRTQPCRSTHITFCNMLFTRGGHTIFFLARILLTNFSTFVCCWACAGSTVGNIFSPAPVMYNVQCTYILLCLKKFKNISTGCFYLIKRCLKVFKRRNKIWVNKQNVWSKLKLLSAQIHNSQKRTYM